MALRVCKQHTSEACFRVGEWNRKAKQEREGDFFIGVAQSEFPLFVILCEAENLLLGLSLQQQEKYL
jgi:hypothetical protein